MFKSLTPTLSIIAAIVLFFLFVRPQLAEIEKVNAQIDTYNTTIEQYKLYNAKIQSLMQTKDGVSISNTERLEKIIPNTTDTTRTLVDIEALAKKNGLLFGNVSTESLNKSSRAESEAEDRDTELLVHEISFELIGDYDQLKAFLRDIESSLGFMEVTEMSLLATSEKFQQYGFTIQTYSLSNQ
jgi:Tfp pilus assembly protein PilO